MNWHNRPLLLSNNGRTLDAIFYCPSEACCHSHYETNRCHTKHCAHLPGKLPRAHKSCVTPCCIQRHGRRKKCVLSWSPLESFKNFEIIDFQTLMNIFYKGCAWTCWSVYIYSLGHINHHHWTIIPLSHSSWLTGHWLGKFCSEHKAESPRRFRSCRPFEMHAFWDSFSHRENGVTLPRVKQLGALHPNGTTIFPMIQKQHVFFTKNSTTQQKIHWLGARKQNAMDVWQFGTPGEAKWTVFTSFARPHM